MDEKEFEKQEQKLLSNIPHEFHDVLTTESWCTAHSYGYEAVLMVLEDSINNLIEPIKQYTKRILTENQ